MSITLVAAGDDEGRRLDRILRKALRDLPLSAIHRLIRQGSVQIDGKPATASLRIQKGQSIIINLAEPLIYAPLIKKSIKISVTLEIIYENQGLIIINKPSGIPVHGGKGIKSESLETLVRSYLEPKIPPSLSFRPGPLHRLDTNSSGLIAFSTNLEGARLFSQLMKDRRIKKTYLTIVEGKIKKAEIWQDELIRDDGEKRSFASQESSSKTAITRIKPIAGNETYTLIQADIETGRTHQIRAQAASRGHPLFGDKKYGARLIRPACGKSTTFLLHAFRMEFPPPLPAMIEAPLPNRFKTAIVELFGKDTLDLPVFYGLKVKV